MPRPAEWCEHECKKLREELADVRADAALLRANNGRLRAEIEWLTKVLSDIHGDGRCPSWLCQHIEIILGDHVFLPEE